jgi:hypothetical protein
MNYVKLVLRLDEYQLRQEQNLKPYQIILWDACKNYSETFVVVKTKTNKIFG